MKVPKKVQIIGHVQNIAWVPTKARNVRDLSFWDNDCILAVNQSLNTIFLFPNDVKETNQIDGMNVTKFKAPGGTLKKIGHAFQITYQSNLWEGADHLYYHDFDREAASIWGNSITRPRVIAIKYPRGKIVSDRGIV